MLPHLSIYLAGIPIFAVYAVWIASTYPPRDRLPGLYVAASLVWPLAVVALLLYGAVAVVAGAVLDAIVRVRHRRQGLSESANRLEAR